MDLFGRFCADVGEMLEGAHGAPADRAGIGGPQAVAEGFDTRAIDPLPMLDLQMHHRMLADIRRGEADAKARARPHRGLRTAHRRGRRMRRGPALRGAQLSLRIAWHRQQRKRIHRVASIAVRGAGQRGADLREQGIEPGPDAALLPRVREHRQRIRIARVELQRS